ncbi:MAG: hypothetical protein KAR40_15350 [Candidatus Sabulitectum sp.]|nr:hypothetical protein [Candidatus Sabulitectum sp.]
MVVGKAPKGSTAASGIDGQARQLDPETFKVYDALAEVSYSARQSLEDISSPGAKAAQAEADVLTDELTELLAAQASDGAKSARTKKIATTSARRAEAMERAYVADEPAQKLLRHRMVDAEGHAQSLVPLIARAYGKARGHMGTSKDEYKAVASMVRESDNQIGDRLPEAGAEVVSSPTPNDLHTRIGRGRVGRDEGNTDVLRRVLAEEAKVLDANTAQYRDAVSAFDANDKTLTVDGYDHEFDLDGDEIHVPIADGEGSQLLTVREILEQGKRDEQELGIIQRCSQQKTS